MRTDGCWAHFTPPKPPIHRLQSLCSLSVGSPVYRTISRSLSRNVRSPTSIILLARCCWWRRLTVGAVANVLDDDDDAGTMRELLLLVGRVFWNTCHNSRRLMTERRASLMPSRSSRLQCSGISSAFDHRLLQVDASPAHTHD